jgi:flagellar P-ring protein precursor FlgI
MWATPLQAVRIKDIAEIKGVRQNQLIGYGLVVGLVGTGDGKNSKFTVQSMAAMLERMGITVDPSDIKVDNVAAVMVTADLQPFARVGSRMDILVSAIGGARSLQGGTLLFTPLKAADGHIYAIGQGPVSTGGFTVQGATGSSIHKNFTTVGRVVDGALIERELTTNFNARTSISLALKSPDFTTATRMALAINTALFDHVASTPDAGTILVKVPEKYLGNVVGLVTRIERLNVEPDAESKVIINERTGTVIMGSDVRIATIAIAHGNLSIEIQESFGVSQPLPFSDGRTVVTPRSNLQVKEDQVPLMVVESGVSIGEVVRALNALGATPRDLIAIFQALKAAGALQAKLEII